MEINMTKTNTETKPISEKKCKNCNGYGLWAIGGSTPVGSPMKKTDAIKGYVTNPCPNCGANANPHP